MYREPIDTSPEPATREDRLARLEARAAQALPVILWSLLTLAYVAVLVASCFFALFALIPTGAALFAAMIIWMCHGDDCPVTKYPVLVTGAWILAAAIPWALALASAI